MNSTLETIGQKFGVDLRRKPPVNITCINRQIMAETLGELGFQVGAEIGVAQGHHARLLCELIPRLKLYCIDIWEGYAGYNEYIGYIERYYREAQERLKPYDCQLIKAFSMQAVQQFENGSLDFVYIDGAHDLKSVVEDLCEWTPKVRVGGIVYGHDYKRRYAKYVIQVKDAVQAYMYSHNIAPWFVLGEDSNHSDGKYREGTQSWMFVRQESDRLRK